MMKTSPLDIKTKSPKLYFKIKKSISRAISDFGMFERNQKIAVALSGGKDSVTLLLFLKHLNYNVEAFFLDLGIKRFSLNSLSFVQYICDELNINFHILSAKDFAGFTVDETVSTNPGMQCAICGTLKRQMFNRFALDNDFDALAVGHNMDDEAHMLLANNLKWDFDYLSKSFPVIEAKEGFVKRVKPLCYLREKEIRTFVRESEIDVLHCQCPHSSHGSRKKYNKILQFGSELFEGFTESYYLNFLKKFSKLNYKPSEPKLNPCKECGQPTSGDLCRLCLVKKDLWRK